MGRSDTEWAKVSGTRRDSDPGFLGKSAERAKSVRIRVHREPGSG